MELHKVISRSKETHRTSPLRCQVTYLYEEKINKHVTRHCSGTMHLVFDENENVYRGLTNKGFITEKHVFAIGEVFKVRV